MKKATLALVCSLLTVVMAALPALGATLNAELLTWGDYFCNVGASNRSFRSVAG